MEELRKEQKIWYVKHAEVEEKNCYISGPLIYSAALMAIILFKGVLAFRGGKGIISVEKEPVCIEEGDISTIIEKEVESDNEEGVKMYLLKKSDNN